MLTVSDQIQIPPKTTHKDTGTKVNESYYFISYYSVNKSIFFFLLANTAFGPLCAKLKKVLPPRTVNQKPFIKNGQKTFVVFNQLSAFLKL